MNKLDEREIKIVAERQQKVETWRLIDTSAFNSMRYELILIFSIVVVFSNALSFIVGNQWNNFYSSYYNWIHPSNPNVYEQHVMYWDKVVTPYMQSDTFKVMVLEVTDKVITPTKKEDQSEIDHTNNYNNYYQNPGSSSNPFNP